MGFVEEFFFQNISAILLASTVLLSLWYNTRRPSGLPPGPRLLPVVGNLLSLRGDIRQNVRRLREEYGDVFSLYLGRKLVIFFNGFETLKEAFVESGSTFSNRPTGLFYQRFTKEQGVASSSGRTWQEQRKFTQSTLRDLGFGRTCMEGTIQEQILTCLNMIEEEKGRPVDLNRLFSITACNAVSSLAFGMTFDPKDEKFLHFMTRNADVLDMIGSTAIIHFFPEMEHCPGDPCNIKIMRKYMADLMTFSEEIIQKHKRECDGVHARDFIDAYLMEMEKRKDDKDSTFTEHSLHCIVLELFTGGSESISITIGWGILYLALNPEEQSKIQAEIDDVIGNSRLPTMADRTSLSYTQAAILEIHRNADTLPLGLPRAAGKTTTFRGYTIPEDVMLFPCFSSVLHDPLLWSDPEKFRPSRFLDSEGKVSKDLSAMINPFSIGHRNCLGESLARMELFLVLTALLQRFTFHLPEDEPQPSLDGVMGAARVPVPYKICAVKRKV